MEIVKNLFTRWQPQHIGLSAPSTMIKYYYLHAVSTSTNTCPGTGQKYPGRVKKQRRAEYIGWLQSSTCRKLYQSNMH